MGYTDLTLPNPFHPILPREIWLIILAHKRRLEITERQKGIEICNAHIYVMKLNLQDRLPRYEKRLYREELKRWQHRLERLTKPLPI